MEQQPAAPTAELVNLADLSVTQVGQLVHDFLSRNYNERAGQDAAAAFVAQNIDGSELGEYQVADLQAPPLLLLALTGPRARALWAEIERIKTAGVPAESL